MLNLKKISAMNYDTQIYEVCEKLFSTYLFYSAKFEKDDEGFLMCARIYSYTDLFSCQFMSYLIALKGSILISFSSDDSGRPVITMFNDIEV